MRAPGSEMPMTTDFKTRTRHAAVLALWLAAVTACTGKHPAPEPVPVGAKLILTISDYDGHLVTNDHSQFRDSVRLVIDNQDAFDSVWKLMSGGPKPVVDFAESQVFVAALPGSWSAGPQIYIDTVADYAETRIVIVRRVYPSTKCIAAADIRTPVAAVVVPRTTVRSIRFVERLEALKGCRRFPYGADPTRRPWRQ